MQSYTMEKSIRGTRTEKNLLKSFAFTYWINAEELPLKAVPVTPGV